MCTKGTKYQIKKSNGEIVEVTLKERKIIGGLPYWETEEFLGTFIKETEFFFTVSYEEINDKEELTPEIK